MRSSPPPLVPSLDRPASQVAQTFTAIQQELKDLQQMNWKSLSATLETTRLAFVKFTRSQGAKKAVSDLAQRATKLQTDIKGFRSQTVSDHQHLTTQLDTLATNVAALNSATQAEGLDAELENLQETLQQHADTDAQQAAAFKKRQTAIQETFKKLTAVPLAPSLDRPASQVRHTLGVIERDLRELQQMKWKDLSAKLGATVLTFTESYDRILLIRILDDFANAYERRDFLHLKLMTSMSESRSRNLDLMFKTYSRIDAHTIIVSTSKKQVEAKLIINKLVNKKGESITPNFIIAETKITISQKDGKWGKIQW